MYRQPIAIADSNPASETIALSGRKYIRCGRRGISRCPPRPSRFSFISLGRKCLIALRRLRRAFKARLGARSYTILTSTPAKHRPTWLESSPPAFPYCFEEDRKKPPQKEDPLRDQLTRRFQRSDRNR